MKLNYKKHVRLELAPPSEPQGTLRNCLEYFKDAGVLIKKTGRKETELACKLQKRGCESKVCPKFALITSGLSWVSKPMMTMMYTVESDS